MRTSSTTLTRQRVVRARRGFTMIELTIAMGLLLLITGVATQFLRRQTNLVNREGGRMDALQNAEFAVSQVDRELREAGAGVVDIQPMLVQIDSNAMTFNANMVSIDTGDVRAIYQMRDGDTNGVRAMFKSERMALPNSYPVVNYPDTTYMSAGGIPSAAETITYFLRPDSTTTITNRYLLFRRVNALTPTLIASGLVRDSRDTVPFFTYYKTDTMSKLVPIARSQLPYYHNMIHGSPGDTARSALTDSIRAVRIHFLTAARDPKTGLDGLRTVESLVRLANAGLVQRSSCGQPPLPLSVSPTVVSTALNVKPAAVTITWGKVVDDGAGEKDIERYAIYRRLSTSASFGDPISSVPAGKASYSFTDTAVLSTQTYVYGIAAQDCTPEVSSVAASAPVTVN
jgi:prepilin-type N-terminal cleavage/methylation domain-containing protein